MKFHHIGLFVANLADGRKKLSSIIPIAEYSNEIDDANLKVRVQFAIDYSGISYELVAPFGDNNPVAQILLSGKAILNHVAYRVKNFEDKISELRASGAVPLGAPASAVAFNGKRVIFFLTPLKFIIELIESP